MDNFTPHLNSILLLTFSATTAAYLLRRRTKPSPEKKPLPSPLKLPIIGHLHLLTDMPHHSFTKLAKQLGPIIHLQLGRVPTLLISSPQLAKLVLRTHDHIFSNRPQLIAAQYLSFNCSDVTFSSFGPYWKQVRKICVTELLSPKRVNSFHSIRSQEINRLINGVSNGVNIGVNLSELLFQLANDVLCRVAFGKRFEDQDLELKSVLNETQNLLAGFCIGDFFPEWDWVNSVSGMKRRLLKNLKDLSRVCDEIISEHLKKDEISENQDLSNEDFVDVLLRIKNREDLEVPITDDNLKALILDMFVAGTDTTSATLEWIMTELIRHPEVMKIAQNEVRTIVRQSGKENLELSHIQNLHYLNSVIKETMRLHPPVPLLVPRESMVKCTLDGYEIPEKTRVLINTYAIGRDSKVWEDPLEYKPERFEKEEIDFRGQDFRFLPFGGGRRGCPGYAFGLATVELALASLLYHFDWELLPGQGPDDVDLTETFGLATRKKTPLLLVPTTINKTM